MTATRLYRAELSKAPRPVVTWFIPITMPWIANGASVYANSSATNNTDL